MPYQTGAASSFADLKSEIETFLTVTGGYTLTGDVLSKAGTKVHALLESTVNNLQLTIGKTSSAGVLSGVHPALYGGPAKIFMCATYYDTAVTIVWPVTYHFHYFSSPVESFTCVIEYNNGYCQNMSFGEIEKATAMDGGVYADASACPKQVYTFNSIHITALSWAKSTSDSNHRMNCSPLPFGWGASSGSLTNRQTSSYVWAETNGFDWFGSFLTTYSGLGGSKYERGAGLSFRSPLSVNVHAEKEAERSLILETDYNTLVPIKLFGNIATGNLIKLGDVPHIRWTNIKNYSFGETFDDGTDKWKMYPAFFKNGSVLNGTGTHSGQIGFALRYDGV
jgi:hypothetical protein